MPILSKASFDDYAGQWAKTVQSAGTEWTGLFQLGPAWNPPMPQANVYFDINGDIIPLIATPNVKWVVASFLYNNTQPGPQFQIALWGTAGERDPEGNIVPVTPYYSGVTEFAIPDPAITGEIQPFTNMDAEEIPCTVVNNWLSAWVNNSNVNSSQFLLPGTPQQVLQGYAFPFNDFVNPLFRIDPSALKGIAATDFWLRLDFGLKTYYQANGEAAQLFGLLARVADRNSKVAVSSASFDLSMPVPPGPGGTAD